MGAWPVERGRQVERHGGSLAQTRTCGTYYIYRQHQRLEYYTRRTRDKGEIADPLTDTPDCGILFTDELVIKPDETVVPGFHPSRLE